MQQTITRSIGSKVKVVERGLSVEKAKEQLMKSRSWKDKLYRHKKNITFICTFYYPYYFSEWKVKVPRFLFREGRALIRVGVNGITGVTAQTELWPDHTESELGEKLLLPATMTKKEANKECKRYLESFVYKTMRPLKPPIYELNREVKVYLPYYIFSEKVGSTEKRLVIESLTGIKAPLKNMSEIKGLAEKIDYLATF